MNGELDDFARQDPPVSGPEKDMLAAFLDYHRATLLHKAAGLSDAELRRSFVPSGTNLLSLVKHLAYVERWWFQHVFAGADVSFPWSEADPDAEFRVEPGETAAGVIALYQQESRASREIVRQGSLDDVARRPDAREPFTLRWIMIHMIGEATNVKYALSMIEETARHNGHADLLRELIDGATGE